MTDANIRAANLRSGEVQVIDTVSTQDVDSLRRQPGVGLLQVGSLGYQGVTFNTGNTKGVGEPPGEINTPLAKDARVRKAFEYALDRKGLVNSVFNNWVEPACSPISPDTDYATEASNACTPYDPKKSSELLREAGVKTPLHLEMAASNTPDTLRLAQALQALVKKGGFDLEIQPVEYSTLLDQQDRGDFQLLQLGWSGRDRPARQHVLLPRDRAGAKRRRLQQREGRRAAHQGRAADEAEERAKTYGEVVTQIQKDPPIVYLYRQRNLTAYSDDVVGISTYADGVVRLGKAAFVEGN